MKGESVFKICLVMNYVFYEPWLTRD